MDTQSVESEELLLAEVQVLLAQLRTHLSLVRTGAVLLVSTVTVAFLLLVNYSALPPSLQGLVHATNAGLAALALLGLFMFANSERKILKIGRLIKEAERRNTRVKQLIV